jgi:hypothetical protein
VENRRSSIFLRELKEKVVRKMEAGVRAAGGRKLTAGRIDRIIHRMHSGRTEGK